MKPCSLENFLNKVDESLRSPPVVFFFLSVSSVVNKNKTCIFSLFFFLVFFFLLLWIWPLFYFCWWCVYLLHEYQSVHWFLFTFCLTWHLYLCIILLEVCFFCYSSVYVITIFAEICENVDSTKGKKKKGKKKPTRQVSQNLKKLSRPAETDNTDFNISLLFTLAKTFEDVCCQFLFSFSK